MHLLAYLTVVAQPQLNGPSADYAQVLAFGTAIAIKEGCWLGDPIHYAVFFSGSLGDGIEMVQALDEAHAVDIVLAQHPDAHVKVVSAASIEGMNKHRLLFSWLELL